VAVRELSREYGERQVVIYVRGTYFICMLCYFDYGVVCVLANRLRDKQQILRMKSCSDGNRRIQQLSFHVDGTKDVRGYASL